MILNILILSFQPLWAEISTESLAYRVLDSGSILIYQGNQFTACVSPEIFTMGWSYHTFSKSAGKKKRNYSGFCDLGEKSSASLEAKVEAIANGLHVRYTLIPNQSVTAVCVRTALDLTYNDWKGVAYQVGQDHGQTPATFSSNGILSSVEAQTLSLGPASNLKGLSLQLNPGSGHIVLQDNRKWSPNLIPFITNGEPSDKPWVWPARNKKIFDFTVIFNRPIHKWVGENTGKVLNCSEKEISFINHQAGVTIYGTLSLPKGPGPFPIVEIITGAGPDPRNSYMDNLTEALASRGIADLLYDKRGTGRSSGNYQASTSQDFADDAACGVEYLKSLKNIDPQKIGLLGHSEGGMIAPMVAAGSKDVGFIVLMAGPGVTGDRIIMRQQESIDENRGLDKKTREIRLKILKRLLEMIKEGKDDAFIESKVKDVVREEMGAMGEIDPKALSEAQAEWQENEDKSLKTPWTRFFILHDPRISLRRVDCPVLAIAGDQDWNVPPDESLPAIEGALKEGKNIDYTVKLLPGIGHGFGVRGGSIDPSQVIDPEVLTIIGDWIEKHTKN